MTTDPHDAALAHELPADEVLEARDRVAQHRVRAEGALRRGRLRRRILPKVAAVGAVLATLAIADGFVTGAVARTAAVAPAPTAATPGRGSSSTALALAQVSQTLAADQRAIVALAAAQARLAASAGEGDNGGGSGSASAASIQLPSLSSGAPLPSFSPPAVAPPAVSATTGASVVVP